jgi:fructuronate reductase
MLAYLGLATGKTTIADAVGEDAFRLACSRMMA